MMRQFEDREAVRDRVPLLIGLAGPSSSGKTYSALRLATGMQRVTGSEILVVDTESGRAAHYADVFKFRHLKFTPPYSPDDYRAAIEHCVGKGAGVIVLDSLSHEHEGAGGVLEEHERELDRMAGQDWKKRERATFAAWVKPKQGRTRLINYMVTCGANIICCFRAKPKLRIKRGQDPVELGFMPIAGDEFVYEQTVQCLLYPASGGIPTWKPDMPGEKQITKLPAQFEGIFMELKPLSEAIGQQLAEWAAGSQIEEPTTKQLPRERADSEIDWWDRTVGIGERPIRGKRAKLHTWRWFSEGDPNGARHRHLRNSIEKIDEMGDAGQAPDLQAYKHRAIHVCQLIEAKAKPQGDLL